MQPIGKNDFEKKLDKKKLSRKKSVYNSSNSGAFRNFQQVLSTRNIKARMKIIIHV